MTRYFLRGLSTSSPVCYPKWVTERKLKGYTHMAKALQHFDEFYSTVYTNKWPSIRLGLLSPPKYVAVGNNFTGEIEGITKYLEKLGAFDVSTMWSSGLEKLRSKKVEDAEMKEDRRISKMDGAVKSFVQSRVAEEMDVLYQNLPDKKIPIPYTSTDAESKNETVSNRIFSDITDAANQYVTATKLRGLEEFQLESEYYGIGSQEDELESTNLDLFSFTSSANYTALEFPQFLKAYAFEEGNSSNFPNAGTSESTGLKNYICVNGGSIAPIIALDLKPGVNMLDLCSGPGTKSLLSMMTMCPALITCNELHENRLSRVNSLLREFTGSKVPENVRFVHANAVGFSSPPVFDRILADVPCSMDRISITEPDNNLFKPTRVKERLSLVQTQRKILLAAFRCLKLEKGSTVVYSTCSLSPVENDGVVMAALKESDISSSLTVDVLGIWNALKPLQEARLFHLMRTKFGVVILPDILSNCGPMYVSRIIVN